MRKVVSLAFPLVVIASCSWFDKDHRDRGWQASDGPVLQSCDSVVTEEAVAAYHSAQSQFRVEPAGWDISCRAFVEINGSRTEVERKGKSTVRVFPRLKFVSLQREEKKDAYQLTVELPALSETDVKSIFQGIGVTRSDEVPVIDSGLGDPGYIRFGSGNLFYLSSGQRIPTSDGRILRVLRLVGTGIDGENLHKKILAFQSGQTEMEWLWSPKKGRTFRLVNTATEQSSPWSDVDSVKVLASMVRDGEFAGLPIQKYRAIEFAIWWDVDVKEVHKVIPELFTFAEETWRSTSIADNTASDLIVVLRYIVKIYPNDPKSVILSSHDRLYKYVNSEAESLRISVDYVTNARWTEAQFKQLLATAEILYPSYSDRSWPFALEINDRLAFDATQTQFFAKIGMMMKKNNLLAEQGPEADADSIEAKLSAGLNAENSDLYFYLLQTIKSEFNVDSTTALIAADRWVLTGRINSANKALCLEFLRWLDRDVYVDFAKASEVFEVLSVRPDFAQAQIPLFKSVFSWLSRDAYINREEALTKASTYFKNDSFSDAQFDILKSSYSWLVSTVYLNRSESLEKSEGYTLAAKPLTSEKFNQLKSMFTWYANSMYLNRSDALLKSEDVVISKDLSVAQTDLLMDSCNWLVSSAYLSRPDAIQKSYSYVVERAMDPDKFGRLKLEYDAARRRGISRDEALTAAEKIAFGL